MSVATETFLISPLSVPGCQLWLDAADSTTITLSGANITEWRDKSGNARNATGTGTPTIVQAMQNKLPAVYFNGSSYFTGSLTNTTTQHSFFSVFRFNTGAPQYARLVSFGQNGQFDYNNNAYYNVSYNTGTLAITRSPTETQVTLASPSLDAFHQASIVFNGTNGLYYTDGGTNSNSAAWTAAFNFNQYRLGSDQIPYIPQELQGYIAEVIVYSSGITISDRQKMEGYLAWKWGLTGNLPSTHPYRYSRPLDNIPLPTSLLVPRRPLNNVFVFNPTVISNCVLWLDAADVSTLFQNSTGTNPVRASGSTVAYWRDKSVSANHASNTTAQPTVVFNTQNGLNVINFNGAQYLNLTPSLLPTGSTQYTFFSVFRTTSTNTQVYLSWGNTVNANGFGRAPQLYITNYTLANDTYGAGGTTDTTVYNSVYVLNTNAADTRNNSWDNGTPFNNTNNTAITLNTGTTFAYVGVGQVNGSLYTPFYMIGQIGEIVGFSRVLSTVERQQMEGYLAWKWGIQANLPVTHPYRTNPPDLPAVAPRGITQVKPAFFNPRNISGIQLWYDVADTSSLTLIGSSLSQINDKSGNGYNATQATSGSRPTYSKSYITFANNTYLDFPQAAINNTTRYSLFLVFYPIASLNWIIQKQYNGVGSYNMLSMTNYWQNNTGTTNYLYWAPHANTGVVNSGSAMTLNSVQIVELIYDGTTLSIYRNGTLLNTATSGPTLSIVNQTSATNCTIGSWRPDGGIQNSGVTNFQFNELVYHNVFMTTAQRQAIEGYLAWKWGIQGNLPSTHPFKLFPPAP